MRIPWTVAILDCTGDVAPWKQRDVAVTSDFSSGLVMPNALDMMVISL